MAENKAAQEVEDRGASPNDDEETQRLWKQLHSAEKVLIDLCTAIENRAALGGFDRKATGRRVNIARTDFEKGLMMIERAIRAPSGGIGQAR